MSAVFAMLLGCLVGVLLGAVGGTVWARASCRAALVRSVARRRVMRARVGHYRKLAVCLSVDLVLAEVRMKNLHDLIHDLRVEIALRPGAEGP